MWLTLGVLTVGMVVEPGAWWGDRGDVRSQVVAALDL